MGFWGEEEWRKVRANPDGPAIVKGFEENYLKDGCYRLKIGDEAVVSVGPNDKEDARRRLFAGDNFSIKPGQFAHLITSEVVQLPNNAIGLINIATGEKIRGLVNVSGFHVDAGYEGKLIFTVFNAGAVAINLNQGQRLFRLWLMDYSGTPPERASGYTEIPREWADRLVGAYPSPFALATRVADLESELARIRADRGRSLIIYGILALAFVPLLTTVFGTLFSDWIADKSIPALKGIAEAWREHFS